jgi:hypothetical protein
MCSYACTFYFRIAMMSLYYIEKALVPQFYWDHTNTKKFQTPMYKNIGLGMTVFIGIADSFHFPKAEILDYLAVEPKEYATKLQKFLTSWEIVQQRKTEGKLCMVRHGTGYYDYPDLLFLKVQLVLNALRYHGHDLRGCSLL